MRATPVQLVLLLTAVSVFVTSCSSPPPPPETMSVDEEIAPEGEVQEQEAAPEGIEFSETFRALDADGYELEFSVSMTYGPDAYSDVSSEKPGFTTLKVPATSEITMTNVTVGRDYEFSDAGLGVLLGFVFDPASAACSLTGLTRTDVCIVLVKTTNDFDSGLTPTRYSLAPGEAFTFETFNPAYGLLPDRVIPDIAIPGVAEDTFDAAAAEFLVPAGIAAFGWDALSAGCRLGFGLGKGELYLLYSQAPIPGC